MNVYVNNNQQNPIMIIIINSNKRWIEKQGQYKGALLCVPKIDGSSPNPPLKLLFF